MAEALWSGGCRCGALRYEARGTPRDACICHCETCRGVSGAPFLAWCTFDSERFRFVSGEPVSFASSPGVTRLSCAACSAALTYQHRSKAHEIDVTIASLDTPNAVRPERHIWLSQRLDWVNTDDELDHYDESS